MHASSPSDDACPWASDEHHAEGSKLLVSLAGLDSAISMFNGCSRSEKEEVAKDTSQSALPTSPPPTWGPHPSPVETDSPAAGAAASTQQQEAAKSVVASARAANV
ncbi:hypothetical protein VDGL01_05487 [Verticillium dahliae]